MGAADEPLFAGRLGRLRADDVLQFVAQTPGGARVVFESTDRATGAALAVELEMRDGRLVALGPRGSGLRLGDLAVARGLVTRRDVEAAAGEAPDKAAAGEAPDEATAGGGRLGERLEAAGLLAEAEVEDLLWERHARVLWSLLAWERGTFRVEAREEGATGQAPDASEGRAPETRAIPVPVDPSLPIAGLLLDGIQRAEIALLQEASPGQGGVQ